jgi:dynein heavy chain
VTIKGNITKTRGILDKWEEKLMFERKDGKVYTPDEFKESLSTLLKVRYNDIADGGLEIVKLLMQSNKTLKASKCALAWKAYTEHVNDIVIDGFSRAILSSVKYLCSQVDPDQMAKNETAPLLEVVLELASSSKDIVWVPEVGCSTTTDTPGIRDLFNSWVTSFVNIGNLVKRLDVAEGAYIKEMTEDYCVSSAICNVINIVLANEAKCEGFRGSYLKYEYLWKNDLSVSLKAFLAEKGVEVAGTKTNEREEPELALFDKEIQRYKNVQQEISDLPASTIIGWLKIDAKPIKQSLANWVTKWIFLFTEHLVNRVRGSMAELYSFMEVADVVLDKRVKRFEEVEGEEEEEGEGEEVVRGETEATEEGEEEEEVSGEPNPPILP